MNSATYRQSSHASQVVLDDDPENKLFARWKRRRLEAEVIRDSILMKSGSLDLTMGGSMMQVNSNRYVNRGHLEAHSLVPRRTVYLPVYRSTGYEGMKAFDFADPAVPDGNRRTSTVANQSLFLMNSKFMHQSSGAFAKNILSIPEDQRAAHAIKQILGRGLQRRKQRANSFVRDYNHEGKRGRPRSRPFSSNEFLYLE